MFVSPLLDSLLHDMFLNIILHFTPRFLFHLLRSDSFDREANRQREHVAYTCEKYLHQRSFLLWSKGVCRAHI